MPLILISGLPLSAAPLGTDMLEIETALGVSERQTRTLLHTLTGAERFLLPQVNDQALPTLAFGDGDSGFYEESDDVIAIALSGAKRFLFRATDIRASAGGGARIQNEASSSINPTLITHNADANTGHGGDQGELDLIINSISALNISESAGLNTSRIDAGDNAAGNVGTWTNVRSAIATVSSAAGPTLTAVGLIPKGSFMIGLTARITTSFGTSSGLTDFDVGDGTTLDRWANSLAITSGTTMDMTNSEVVFTIGGFFIAATDVVLTAVGGNFDGTGVIELIVHYLDCTAPTG